MSDEDEKDDLGIGPGTAINSAKNSFTVIKLLGEGGFGAVYKVHDTANPSKMYAMKVEKKLETRKHSKLKMEIAILKLVSNERKQSHFTLIIDRGKKENYFFLVMELVGKSLEDLKRARPDKCLSLGTGLGSAIQCLEAVQDLHKYGFIHRDLKPANYACGLIDKKHVGTVRFASISCHRGQELGPHDDCESWFYLLLDLINAAGLPWKRLSERNEVLRMKEECRREKRELMLGAFKCKEDLSKVLDYIDSLQYHDKVDYDYIYKELQECGTMCGFSLNAPYDWEEHEGAA